MNALPCAHAERRIQQLKNAVRLRSGGSARGGLQHLQHPHRAVTPLASPPRAATPPASPPGLSPAAPRALPSPRHGSRRSGSGSQLTRSLSLGVPPSPLLFRGCNDQHFFPEANGGGAKKSFVNTSHVSVVPQPPCWSPSLLGGKGGQSVFHTVVLSAA